MDADIWWHSLLAWRDGRVTGISLSGGILMFWVYWVAFTAMFSVVVGRDDYLATIVMISLFAAFILTLISGVLVSLILGIGSATTLALVGAIALPFLISYVIRRLQ